jgi:hypothetical protein
VYAPEAAPATVKEPVTVKSVAIAQVGEATAPAGEEDIVQLPEALTKLMPETVMDCPIPEEVGVRVIFGTTVKAVVALSPPGTAVTLMVFVSALLPRVFTTNEPVTMPPETEHVELRMVSNPADVVIVQAASPELNPEPETVIVSPPLPLMGVAVILTALTPTENGADADSVAWTASVTVTI